MKKLAICPSVGYWEVENRFYLDKKFYDGITLYSKLWPGAIAVLIRESKAALPQFGVEEIIFKDSSIEFIRLNEKEHISENHLAGIDLVLASADDFSQLHLSELCKQLNKKCIYIIEYILETRLQIARLEQNRLSRKAKSCIWLIAKELQRRKAFRIANGLQANGTAAMDAYSKLTPNALLYFDTRTSLEMGISDSELSKRLDYLDLNQPLRLAFSGRLVAMKGADHLVRLAKQLHAYHLPFTFDIFGGGAMLEEMTKEVKKNGLEKQVRLHGAVDFASQLIPHMKSEVDLFVCCHRQSDPSCTYLETYACGVPIIGYDNRAHQGMLDRCDTGWAVRMDDINALAQLIIKLSAQRDDIRKKAINAATFSRNHSFEQTFMRRIAHCEDVAEIKKP